MNSLKNQVVFITGASRGVGKACALACAQAGANIVVAAKTAEANPKLPGTIYDTVREVEALGSQALAIQLDVRDADACEAAIAQTVGHFGRIDVLINNAGAAHCGMRSALRWCADKRKTPRCNRRGAAVGR